ncbi:alpha-1,2-glucosyltransferase Alg10 [Arctopsyche grandis]|uniref:alpha-1,2-glucosyltransferase Alg10 n=1 Tax=Arctopsyche grandis TaxID=121162 RepID=UPI00406D8B40
MTLAMKKTTIVSAIILYFTVAVQIFNYVFMMSQTVIDELFHIPQGLQYCNLNFTYWDEKITTLPGLYLISTLVIGPFLECSIYLLRFTNLLASCVNIYLINSIVLKTQKNYDFKTIVQVMNIALLPPLFFFSNLYYTDTLSLTFVLLFINSYLEKGRYIALVLYGQFAIIVRQTNVIWVALCLGNALADLLVQSYIENRNSHLPKTSSKGKDKSNKPKMIKNVMIYNFSDLSSAITFHIQSNFHFVLRSMTFVRFCEILAMVSVMIGFMIFVLINGSVVVGDKSAHTASVHIPQLFYFTLFYGFFSIPFVLRNVLSVLRTLIKNKLKILLVLAVCLVIVRFNTLIHPYLLADNRHYTFYIWNKFYGKYWFAKYVVVPVYVFLGFSIYENVKSSTSAGFIIPFLVCLFASVALQKMIEVRYFFIPYVILKMRFAEPSWTTVVVDFIINTIVSYITFNIFFTKEIIWSDFNDIQRLIW